jgi:hypothetical protein
VRRGIGCLSFMDGFVDEDEKDDGYLVSAFRGCSIVSRGNNIPSGSLVLGEYILQAVHVEY